jgi:hypothetical protein
MILKKMKFEFFGLIALSMILFGCGSSQNSTNYSANGTCSTGYLYSASYGCLPQSNCQSGYALYNNSCVYVGYTTSYTNGTNTCSSGYVYTTQYGCQAQGTTTCSAGYVSTATYGCVLSSGTTTGTTTYQGTCQVGQIQTTYGCLPQGNCMAGYGYYGGWCIKSVYLN